MKSSPFKSSYRFGGTVFVLSVLVMSLIFGGIFKGCSTDNVVTVNLTDHKEKTGDTVVVEKIIEKKVRDTVRVYVQPKVVIPKKDTSSK